MTMKSDLDPRVSPWRIDEADFPEGGAFEDRARFLLGYVTLAPSGHNTQPWKFRIGKNRIDFLADYDSRLPVADPDDRELTISIGAAVMNLKVAAANLRLACTVDYCPEPADEALLARATLGEGSEADERLAALFSSITRRRTNRFPFEKKGLDDASRLELENLTIGDRAAAEIISDNSRKGAIADLVEKGDRIRMVDKDFRSELAGWIWTPRSGKSDGIATDGLGIPQLLANLGPWIIKTFNSGKSSGRKDARFVRDAAAAVLFHSPEDREGWLETGELLEMFILTLVKKQMQYSFFSLPVELPDTRAGLKEVAGVEDEPQILIRIGYGGPPPSKPMPRRPLDQVIVA